MYKKLILFLLVSILPIMAQWEQISTIPIQESLRKSYRFSQHEWLISTSMDYFLKTEDDFRSFRKIYSPVIGIDPVIEYKFFDDGTGFVLKKKHLIKTTDKGETWNTIQNAGPDTLQSISFINKDTGWVSSTSCIYFSSNGGLSWDTIYTGGTKKIVFLNGTTGYAVMNAKIFKTSDAGSSWTQLQLPPDSFQDIIFQNEQLGMLIAKQQWTKLYLSQDGGLNWQPTSPGYMHLPLHVSFIDSTIIIADGDGLGARSDDFGNSWEHFRTRRLNYYDFGKEVYIGMGSDGRIVRSTNRGKLWVQLGRLDGGDKIIFVDSLNGFISPFFKTTDGGNKWFNTYIGFPLEKMTDYHFHSLSRGIAGWSSYLFSTSDGGENWDTVHFGDDDEILLQIEFVDTLNGWLLLRKVEAGSVGAAGVRRTTDGGVTWSDFYYVHVYEFDQKKILFLTDKTGFMYNDEMEYGYSDFKTTDGGITWNRNEFAQTSYMSFVDTSIGFALYHSSPQGESFIKTTDAGDSFQIVVGSPQWTGSGIYFLTEMLGWKVNYVWQNDLYLFEITYDGGLNWETEYALPQTINVNRIGWKLHNNILFAGIVGGALFKRNLILVNSGEQTDTYDYGLELNYPNPFNPTTTIRYSIPNGLNQVKLSIYDVLGNEIAILENEEKPGGKYSLQWNASEFASGVYFYKLTAGEFTSTKKLLLMK